MQNIKKGLLGIITIIALIGVGCSVSHSINTPQPSIEQVLSPVILMINECSADSSFNTMTYRADYRPKDTTLVIYLNRTLERNTYRWEIPLKMVDKTNLNLFRQDYNVSSITLSIYANQLNVKYFMDDKLKSKSGQFILYLGKCFGSDDKDKVLALLRQAISQAQSEEKK